MQAITAITLFLKKQERKKNFERNFPFYAQHSYEFLLRFLNFVCVCNFIVRISLFHIQQQQQHLTEKCRLSVLCRLIIPLSSFNCCCYWYSCMLFKFKLQMKIKSQPIFRNNFFFLSALVITGAACRYPFLRQIVCRIFFYYSSFTYTRSLGENQ